jgi:hypothetical protein
LRHRDRVFYDDFGLSLLLCNLGGFNRDDGYIGTVIPAFPEFHPSVDQGEKGMIFAHAYVKAGIMTCASLADDDIAGLGELASVNLNAEPLAV